MAEVSRPSSDFAEHPDVGEMRARYAQVLAGSRAVVADGLVLLTGLYLAISPWVVNFRATHPDVAVNNLILGIALAVMGLGLTGAPERMYGLSWTAVVIGVWEIISPWTATPAANTDAGLIWNNVVVGAVTVVLGLIAASMLMASSKRLGQPVR